MESCWYTYVELVIDAHTGVKGIGEVEWTVVVFERGVDHVIVDCRRSAYGMTDRTVEPLTSEEVHWLARHRVSVWAERNILWLEGSEDQSLGKLGVGVWEATETRNAVPWWAASAPHVEWRMCKRECSGRKREERVLTSRTDQVRKERGGKAQGAAAGQVRVVDLVALALPVEADLGWLLVILRGWVGDAAFVTRMYKRVGGGWVTMRVMCLEER